MFEKFTVAIIGAGPAGLSAAARAAETGISHILLEASSHLAYTVHQFAYKKWVMDEPSNTPLRSAIPFGAGSREAVLAAWQQSVETLGINVLKNAQVTAIHGESGHFNITLANGGVLRAEHIVLAIGVQGNIRHLGVPGDDLPAVHYGLRDPDAIQGETVAVVGGGDAGVEDALALAEHNRVLLFNRHAEFTACKDANRKRLLAAVGAGLIETRTHAQVKQIKPGDQGEFALDVEIQTPRGLETYPVNRLFCRIGSVPPRNLLERFGIQFTSSHADAVPPLTERYESNLPGVYIIGALAGYPLIKQAINQGFEVIEFIRGERVTPIDEALLIDKFECWPAVSSGQAAIQLVRETQPVLGSLTTLQLREFILDSDIHAPAANEIIFAQNDYSNSFFLILSGTVTISLENKQTGKIAFTLSPGDFFGEMGLLSGRPRTATATAGENCLLVETSRRAMLKWLHASSGVKRELDVVALKRIVKNYFSTAFAEQELDELIANATSRTYHVGDVVFREGDESDGLYLIRRGSVTVSRQMDGQDVVLAYMTAGNSVGEMSLLANQRRSTTVLAASPTEIFIIPASAFVRIFQKYSSARARITSNYLDRIATSQASQANTASSEIRFLMKHGVGEATDILLINNTLCIQCNNCETACASVHEGVSRLDRGAGPFNNEIHIPVSCRHCEHPNCLTDCPPDAIRRSASGEVFISDKCIGCGNCIRNCTYGVIQLSSGQGGDQPAKAIKCDKCKDVVAGPACVRACPTGAAFRTSPETYLSLKTRTDVAEDSPRWLEGRYFSLVTVLLAVPAVLLATLLMLPRETVHYWDFWSTLVLGVFSGLTMLALSYYGMRRRQYPRLQERRNRSEASFSDIARQRKKLWHPFVTERRRRGLLLIWHYSDTLKGWLNVHIYLGLVLVVTTTLHTRLNFDWNIHSVAYFLLLLVILSGLYGKVAYMRYPGQIARNASGTTFPAMLTRIRELDDQAQRQAMDLPDEINAMIFENVHKTELGGSLWQRLSGRFKENSTQAAIQLLQSKGKQLIDGEQPKLVRDLISILIRKQKLIARCQKQMMLKARMQVWLLLHTPLAVASLAALVAHVFSILVYW